MDIIPEEHDAIVKFLLPEIIELAKKHDGLIEPDDITQRIMIRCIGVGFSLGVAYNQTSTEKQWRERLSEVRNQKSEQAPEVPPASEILFCKCGWYGKVEDQDALGSECGCCPDCGNEDLRWLSDLFKRIKELEGYKEGARDCLRSAGEKIIILQAGNKKLREVETRKKNILRRH